METEFLIFNKVYLKCDLHREPYIKTALSKKQKFY